MADILVAVAVLLGIPFVICIAMSWKREERDREQRRQNPPTGDPNAPSSHSYWGGTGRPGR